jgi:RNA 3'-terminal phosphate cyclase (ATP)
MIEIDGAQGEGGGQILRTSLACSILSGQPVRLFNIRAGRRNPGLAPQHLAGILAAAQICDAHVEGAHLRSTDVRFHPGSPAKAGEYTFDITQLAGQPSAGAVTLLLQAIWLPLALAGGSSRLVLRGGTHVNWSPPAHYLEWVLFPTLSRIGVEADIRLDTWGWYPRGGGQVEVTLRGGARLRGIDLSWRGALVTLNGVAAASNLPAHIPQRIGNRAANVLREAHLPPDVQPLRTGGPSTGAGIFLAVEYENVRAGFSALGERGKPSEKVADEATEALVDHHRREMVLDRHLPDQIIPALALAEGESVLRTAAITRHTLTNIAVLRRFVARPITVDGQENQPGEIRVTGDRPLLPR